MTNRIAIKMMLGILLAVITFHLCIIAQVIPYEITWGGRLKSEQEMYVFEGISIVINLFLAFVLLMKGGYISAYFREGVVNVLLWGFFILFLLNTIGNIFAKTNFEKSFAVLTLILAILLRSVLRKTTGNHHRTKSSITLNDQ